MKILPILLILSTPVFAVCGVTDALKQIRPGSEWNLRGTDYSDLEWLDQTQTKPTQAEINQAITDCQTAVQQSRLQLQADISVIKSTSSTAGQKFQAYQDLMQQKGLLQ